MRRAVHLGLPVVPAMLMLAAALLSPVEPARAFGPTGHRLAGYIAEDHLCREARAALVPLLAGLSLGDAGVWADRIRSEPEWAYTAPWHFINVPDGGSVAAGARDNPDNILDRLGYFEQRLADTTLSRRQRTIALLFLVHLVVDVHQPLHVGRAEDRGGNTIDVQAEGRITTLHAIWDGEWLLAAVRQPGTAARGAGPAESPAGWRERARAIRLPAPPALARWQAGTPEDWARESLSLRPVVYAFGPAASPGLPPVLAPAYLARARTLTRERIAQAGIRLAGRLNAAMGCSKLAEDVEPGRPNL